MQPNPATGKHKGYGYEAALLRACSLLPNR